MSSTEHSAASEVVRCEAQFVLLNDHAHLTSPIFTTRVSDGVARILDDRLLLHFRRRPPRYLQSSGRSSADIPPPKINCCIQCWRGISQGRSLKVTICRYAHNDSCALLFSGSRLKAMLFSLLTNLVAKTLLQVPGG